MKVLLFIMGALEIGDAVFTQYAVGRQIVTEANSLMEVLINNGDFLLLKITGVVICSICLWLLYRRFRRVAVTVTSGVVAFYSAVVLWNTGVFLNA